MSGTVIGVPGSELRDRLLCQVQFIDVPGTELRDRILCQVQL